MIGIGNLINDNQDIVFYNDEEGNFNVEVLIKDEDVWLNTKMLSQLFKIDRSGVIKHISDIYNDEELNKKAAEKAKETEDKLKDEKDSSEENSEETQKNIQDTFD